MTKAEEAALIAVLADLTTAARQVHTGAEGARLIAAEAGGRARIETLLADFDRWHRVIQDADQELLRARAALQRALQRRPGGRA